MDAKTQAENARDRGETPDERADRNFIELLQGFRVAVTGVQVLFAFLLTVPFQVGFARLSETDRRLYVVALAAAAMASVCYITPAAQHRILFRQGLKEPLVHRSNLYGIVGGVALAISMTVAAGMMIDYLYGNVLGIVMGAALAMFAAWAWFIQPAITRMRDDD